MGPVIKKFDQWPFESHKTSREIESSYLTEFHRESRDGIRVRSWLFTGFPLERWKTGEQPNWVLLPLLSSPMNQLPFQREIAGFIQIH